MADLQSRVDRGTGEIAAYVLTESYADEAAQAPALLVQVDGT